MKGEGDGGRKLFGEKEQSVLGFFFFYFGVVGSGPIALSASCPIQTYSSDKFYVLSC